MSNHRGQFDPRSGASEAAFRAAQQAEDELATQEAIAARDAADPGKTPGITSREEIAGRSDLEIAHGVGYGGCSFSMIAKPAPAPDAVVQETTEQEIEAEQGDEQTVGGTKP